MTMLISATGLSARIHHLPGREPFMLGQDLAEAYGTQYYRVTEAVKRNPDRFDEDFAFYLTVEEAARLPQNAGTSPGKRTDLRQLVFTHIGAYALSGVLKTPTAAEVSKHIHRTFAAMEKRAFEQMRSTLSKMRHESLTKKPIYNRIVLAATEERDIDWLFRNASYPRHKLEQAVRECVGLGLIAAPLAGMQPDLFEAAQHG